MRRFRAPALPAEGGRVLLDPEASHHLLRVTLVARGERVRLFDGAGAEAEARLVGVEQGLAVLEAEPPTAARAGEEVWLLPSLVRHEAFDTLLRMATELGVTRILPVIAARSVARGERLDRWRRILSSSAAQCGRADEPEIQEPTPLAAALSAVPERYDRRVYVPGEEAHPGLAPPASPCALLLGPEGGLEAAEVALAVARGFTPDHLGPNVLRADTAAVVALARRNRQPG